MNGHITVDQLIETCSAMCQRILYSTDEETREIAFHTLRGISLQLKRMCHQIAGEG